MPLRAGSQISRVLEAFDQGACTTRDVMDITGLPRKHCSAHCRELVRLGFLVDTGRKIHREVGRAAHFYELARPDWMRVPLKKR